MIDHLLVVLIYFGYLFLPGYFLVVSAGIRWNRFLLSYSISISVLVFTLTVSRLFSNNIFHWIVTLNIAIAVIVILSLYLSKKNTTSRSQYLQRALQNFSRRCLPLVAVTILLTGFSIYHFLVGPYTEIPSDFWQHLARVGAELVNISDNASAPSLGSLISTTGNPIYVGHAVVAFLIGTNPLYLAGPATLVTTGIFLATIFWFTFELLSQYRVSDRLRVAGALLAAILTFLSFGTATFSYLRYYAYFPTIFAFPLIYASVAILLKFLERPKFSCFQLLLIPIFLIAMALIHRQEALLTLILLTGIVCVRGIRSYFTNTMMSTTLKHRARLSMRFSLALLIIVTIYTFVSRSMNPWANTPHVLDVGQFFPPFSGVPIDNPTFRFWDTLGYFGLLVYSWFVIRWRSLLRSDFLSAGMLMPFFTNLNPVYAMLFLHFGTATTLWRTAYLMPLAIAGAVLIITSLRTSTSERTNHQRFLGYIFSLFLIISLVPWHYNDRFNRTSRIPSLLPTHETSGIGLWDDLIQQIELIQNDMPVRRILTDSVTGFVLHSATRNEIKRWTDGEYFPKHHPDYRDDFLVSDYNYSLLVINRRNGKTTNSALYASHWRPDILDVSQVYPPDLEDFIARRDTLFKLLWKNNNIQIYLIRSITNYPPRNKT